MKAPVSGTIEKVMPTRQVDGNKFIQEFVLVEENGKKPKHFLIQNWGETKKELEDMALEDRVGEKVLCDCYWNGYQYFSQRHGTQYGVRVILVNIQNA